MHSHDFGSEALIGRFVKARITGSTTWALVGEAEEEGGLEFPTASTTVEAFLKSNGMQEYEEQFKEKVGVSLRSER